MQEGTSQGLGGVQDFTQELRALWFQGLGLRASGFRLKGISHRVLWWALGFFQGVGVESLGDLPHDRHRLRHSLRQLRHAASKRIPSK